MPPAEREEDGVLEEKDGGYSGENIGKERGVGEHGKEETNEELWEKEKEKDRKLREYIAMYIPSAKEKEGKIHVTFGQFVSILSLFSCKEPQNNKIDHLFKLFDFDGDNQISFFDLCLMLHYILGSALLTFKSIRNIAEEILAECDDDENLLMDRREFEQFIDAKGLHAAMTIPF